MIGNWKAVLFDLDGTLIDSEWFYYKAWKGALEQYGVILDPELWLNELAGKTDDQALTLIQDRFSVQIDSENLLAAIREIIVVQNNKETVPLMPGVLELLRYLQERHVTMAVVTSSKRDTALYHLERNNLLPFFNVLVSRCDIQHPKPNPEPYLHCVKQLGLIPADCLVLEDSVTGATAALGAKISCLGVQANTTIRQKLPTLQTFNNLHDVREFLCGLSIAELPSGFRGGMR